MHGTDVETDSWLVLFQFKETNLLIRLFSMKTETFLDLSKLKIWTKR